MDYLQDKLATDPASIKKQIAGRFRDNLLGVMYFFTVEVSRGDKTHVHGALTVTDEHNPIDSQNALKHGRYTAEAIEGRRAISELLKQCRETMGSLTP
ncbi:hypothetical protein [Magnetospira sp. QH-2]|uniref:hypothetical protein n=1 Tax=Magnetospira sp. (strain QH-2) TaxID=1288970 RepID=UPI0011DE1A64|nr:hypothetical protein [Magnetospira sp. QH-2]